MKKKILYLSLGGLLLAGCGGSKPAAPATAGTVRDVAVVEVARATVPDYVEAVGTVRAAHTSVLSAQVVGTVTSVEAHEGQRVRRGETLVVLDDAQQRAAVQRASAAVSGAQQDIAASRAEASLASATLTRYQALYARKSVSPHEMDEVEARAKSAAAHQDQTQAILAQAQAMEAQARSGLGYTRIRAPFDGVVTDKHVDPGTLAGPGVSLLTVEDTARFRLEATVDESDLQHVKLGQEAPVWLDALGAQLAGKVVEIVPAADPASRSFLVKVELPTDSRLRSGFFGRARFPNGSREAVMLPRSAVLERGQLQGVYVVGRDSMAALRYVTVGRPEGDQVEVLSGLESGERVVRQAGERELAGKRIEVRQ